MFLVGRGTAPFGEPIAPPAAAAAALALGAALAATHVANQIADRESDRANAKLPYLARGLVTPRAARALGAAALLAFAAALPAAPPRLVPLLVAALLLGGAYAVPPLSLKERAGWDLAANAFGYGGVAFAIGWGTRAPVVLSEVAPAAAPWVLAVGAVFAATTVADEPGDRAAGQETLAVRLGTAGARRLAVALMAAAAVVAVVVAAPVPGVLAVASLGALLAAFARPSPGRDHLAFQVSAALPVAYAGVRWPAFGLALVALFVGTRAYHERRLGIRYPAPGAPREAPRGAP